MHSGYIDPISGLLKSTGVNGYGWPLFATSSAWGNTEFGAYYFNFGANGVSASNGPNFRWDAFPLRCLARGGGTDKTIVRSI